MKFVKGISLFFIYPVVMFGIGFWIGMESVQFFYPGSVQEIEEAPDRYLPEQEPLGQEWTAQNLTGQSVPEQSMEEEADEQALYQQNLSTQELYEQEAGVVIVDVASSGETLSVDTEYVLEETDILNHTVVETTWKLPGKYVGMNREQFLEAMKEYATYPPLAEMERGFVSLEVLSFSRERVVVQMNYQYMQPSASFYLAVQDNEVVVYLEDKETIYINTGIALDSLPEAVQLDIIQMLWVEDEKSLYNFLENYSS